MNLIIFLLLFGAYLWVRFTLRKQLRSYVEQYYPDLRAVLNHNPLKLSKAKALETNLDAWLNNESGYSLSDDYISRKRKQISLTNQCGMIIALIAMLLPLFLQLHDQAVIFYRIKLHLQSMGFITGRLT